MAWFWWNLLCADNWCLNAETSKTFSEFEERRECWKVETDDNEAGRGENVVWKNNS